MTYKQAMQRKKLRSKKGKKVMFVEVPGSGPEEGEDRQVLVQETDSSESESEGTYYANTQQEKNSRDGDGDSSQSFLSKSSNFLNVVVDTGATDHFVRDENAFFSLQKLEKAKYITCANKKSEANLVIKHEGDILVQDDSKVVGCLRNVLHAPNLAENLFSLRKLVTPSFEAVFDSQRVVFRDRSNGEVFKSGIYDGNFWRLNFPLPHNNVGEERRSKLAEEFNIQLGGSSQKEKSVVMLTEVEKGGSQIGEAVGDEVSEVSKRLKLDSSSSNPEKETDKELGLRYEMRVKDLENINETRMKNLRDCEGLVWHYRLNHASQRYLEMAARFIPDMRGAKFPNEILDCEACKLAKARKKEFSEIRHRAQKPLMRVHSDTAGPLRPHGLYSGARYFITFTDDYSRFLFTYPLKEKSDVHEALEKFLADARRLLGDCAARVKILEFRTDQGTEYKTKEVKAILEREKIESVPCEVETPQHNACRERVNLELTEKIRANLFSAGMPATFWALALKYVEHVHNRTPNSANCFKPPYELFLERAPPVKYIRRFGCVAYSLNTRLKQKSKFAPRAQKGFLVGLNESGYKIYLADSHAIIDTKHVDFVESQVYGDVYAKNLRCPEEYELSFEEEVRNSGEGLVKSSAVSTDQEKLTLSKQSTYDTVTNRPTAEGDEKRKESREEFLGEDDEFEYFYEEEEVDMLRPT
jgi:transposase InsO family protein